MVKTDAEANSNMSLAKAYEALSKVENIPTLKILAETHHKLGEVMLNWVEKAND